MTTLSDAPSNTSPTEAAQPRSVLVIGASGGIGQSVSRAFGKAGWFVGIHYHQGKSAAETTLRQIEQAGGSGAVYEADIRHAQSVEQVVKVFCRDSLRPICFVCTAAVGDSRLLLKLPGEEWHQVIATNLTGMFHCLRAMAPPLQAQGGGSIVVVGSYAAYQGFAGQAAYAASKAGLIGLVKTAALEWGPQNVRINLLLPGWQKTRLSETAMPKIQGWQDHALARPPALEEVVRTIVHLAQLNDVSGQVWNCDSRGLCL
jgi:3-oxoacyl-[acyl-carrier protein] reductase